MIGVPIAVLLFFGVVVRGGSSVDETLPGILTLAIVASGLVNLGIATAYERGYGVLKRLGGSPLGRSGVVAAKLGVVVAIALAQVGGLVGVALALGWRPGPDASLPALAIATVIGAAAFAGLGLAIAGTFRPEAALVVANVAFLLVLGLGGALMPIGALPAPLAAAVSVLPVGALSEAFASALGSGAQLATPLGLTGAWAIGALLLAVRTFRWD